MTSAAQAQIEYIAQYGGPELYAISNPNSIYNPDLKKHLCHRVTLTNNVTVGQPLNPVPAGNLIVLQLVQDATGSRTVAWAGCYRDAPNWAAGGAALSTALAMFMFDGQSYQYIGGSSAFALQTTALTPASGGAAYLTAVPTLLANPAPSVAAITFGGVAPGFQRNTIVARGPTVGAVTMAGVAPSVPISIIVPAGGALTQTPTLGITGNAPVRTP